MKFILISILTIVLSSGTFAASSHVGMIVKKQGHIELLTKPSSKVSGKGPHVLFNKKYYTLKKVRLGLKIGNGSVIRTGKGAKLKIVYKNGDQFNVGEGTAYEISWKSKNKKGKKRDAGAINLLYGSVRGIIKKNGPRSGLKVKTKQAVMGIRGTDFHIGQHGTSGKSTVSVLRGKVVMADKNNLKKKISIVQGFSAEIKREVKRKKGKKQKKKTAVFQVAKTTKNELVHIQKDSDIKQDKNDIKNASVSVKKELAKLQKKAVATTLGDIKEYNPELYKSIKDKNIDDIDNINKIVVGKIFEKAPVKKRKASIDHDELEDDAYNRYFKIN